MTTRTESRRRLRGRRVRAVLAAGLVLGVGAFATLAAWNDTENATGSFGTSIFDTQSQSAGSPTYASNTAVPGASLTFASTAMSPGVSFYAWLNIRTTPATTVGGSIVLTSATPTAVTGTGLTDALQYRAVRMASANPASTCSAAAFTTGTPVFIAGNATTYSPVNTVPASPVSSPIGAAGAELGYCFEVRVAPLTANTVQGATATVTWLFTGTSSS